MSPRTPKGKRGIHEALDEIRSEEGCALPDALVAFSLRAVLAAMSRLPSCHEQLVVKGGTALRLACRKPIGRVSTDLDLSLLDARSPFDEHVITEELPRAIAELVDEIYDRPLTITIRATKRPAGRNLPQIPELYIFRLAARVDLGHQTIHARGDLFRIELAMDELVDPASLQPLDLSISGFPIRFLMYAPVQAISEKLRALLQKLQLYERSGNAGTFQPRHVLDLEFLYPLLAEEDRSKLRPLFDAKCAMRNVPEAERTRARLLHDHLRTAVEAEALRSGRTMAAWQRLEELAAIVCP
jgi:hypothetical protein